MKTSKKRAHQIGKRDARKVCHHGNEQCRQQEYGNLLHEENYDNISEHAQKLGARIQPMDGRIAREILAKRNIPHQISAPFPRRLQSASSISSIAYMVSGNATPRARSASARRET